MKTLIFNGSPRKNGDTKNLLDLLIQKLDGEYRINDAYCSDIKPCMDCRWCWRNSGCCMKDDMQEIYQYIQECDNIVIASPIYFAELTGELLSLASRLQTYFSVKFMRKEIPVEKAKKGAVILVGGGEGTIERPYHTACTLLDLMNAKEVHPVVYSLNTDHNPAVSNPKAVQGIDSIAEFFMSK
ncbi:MAG TPA: flavodoxin family protein [Mobilitalea sp.]|nr:flavodoxin family protein [Mobilitalea sp.]